MNNKQIRAIYMCLIKDLVIPLNTHVLHTSVLTIMHKRTFPSGIDLLSILGEIDKNIDYCSKQC